MNRPFKLIQRQVPEDPKIPEVQSVLFPDTNHVQPAEDRQQAHMAENLQTEHTVANHQELQTMDPEELPRCMEIDLALFESSQACSGLINNYHFRQLISSLCSGLHLPAIDIEVVFVYFN
jgi:hypothetical protein